MASTPRPNTVKFEVQDDVKADVLNVLPAMRAGDIAVKTGLATANALVRSRLPDLRVDGGEGHPRPRRRRSRCAPAMPKSGHMANSHAKVCAAAIVAELNGKELNPQPMLPTPATASSRPNAVHVASVHRYDAAQKTIVTVAGSGGVSDARHDLEGALRAWARNIWADTLG